MHHQVIVYIFKYPGNNLGLLYAAHLCGTLLLMRLQDDYFRIRFYSKTLFLVASLFSHLGSFQCEYVYNYLITRNIFQSREITFSVMIMSITLSHPVITILHQEIFLLV